MPNYGGGMLETKIEIKETEKGDKMSKRETDGLGRVVHACTLSYVGGIIRSVVV
jgi:hypothetical protein